MSEWILVEKEVPECNKSLLLKYLKGNREVITQGYLQDVAIELANCNKKAGIISENGIETPEFWRRQGRGDTYFDYADRQIQSLVAKTSKNRVIAWMEIPK